VNWGLPLWKRGIEGDFDSILWNFFIKLKCYSFLTFPGHQVIKKPYISSPIGIGFWKVSGDI
jgi:hypothetical protein